MIFDGLVVYLIMDVNFFVILNEGYEFKFNFYDFGVDIEFYDVV